MKVKKINLILVAGIVWLIAGINILRIGIIAYAGYLSAVNVLLSVIVYVIFHNMVFRKMVKKHTQRIVEYEEERQQIYKFFNKQAYCIMAFMMTFGIGLRVSGLAPDIFIAVFYTGLGASLVIAGISFGLHYIRQRRVLA